MSTITCGYYETKFVEDNIVAIIRNLKTITLFYDVYICTDVQAIARCFTIRADLTNM